MFQDCQLVASDTFLLPSLLTWGGHLHSSKNSDSPLKIGVLLSPVHGFETVYRLPCVIFDESLFCFLVHILSLFVWMSHCVRMSCWIARLLFYLLTYCTELGEFRWQLMTYLLTARGLLVPWMYIYIFFWIPYWPRMLINILWHPLDANQYGGP